MSADTTQALLERLSHSPIYQEYERAFGEATGLPLRLSPPEDWHLAHHGNKHENPMCDILVKQNRSCAACLETQHELQITARESHRTVRCFAGLCETAVPILAGDKLLGFLRTGEILPHQPTADGFSRIVRRLEKLGIKVEREKLREAYFRSRVVEPRRYESVLKLLEIFAEHLALVANQVVFQSENAEPPSITRVREFINAHYTEEISLSTISQVAHMSTYYFCKQFKKATGLNFTEYLGRIRIEKAKEQLLNPNLRISEVAYEVGFQSLTHFNRVFRKVNGESPTAYRDRLVATTAA
jgi:AraC-like DNA-binding protein/ligand-binding sensor protein